MGRTGIDEVEKTSTAVELGQEESGIGLGLRGFDPLKTGSDGAALVAAFAEDTAPITAEPHGLLNFRVQICLGEKKIVGKMKETGG